MNQIYSTTTGSGTISHIGYGQPHGLSQERYPIPDSRADLRTRKGDAVVLINPEDFSVSIGLRSASVTVGTGATPLPADPLEYRRALVIHNNGSSTVFLGDSNVTIGTGLPLSAGEKIAFDIHNNPNVVVYAVAGSNVDVRIMELA
jgi:hypothetical protein